MRIYPVRNDARYHVTQEATPEGPRFVARFCHEQLGASISRSSAAMLCIGHNQRRKGALVIEAKEA